MSLFITKKEIVLSSPLEGILTYKGKPLSNVKIERNLSWYDGEGEKVDFVVTDEKGHFNLPFVKKELEVNGLVQLVVAQEIYATYKSERIFIWVTAKLKHSEYDELNGKPINVRCDLTAEPWIYRDDAAAVAVKTRCKWDSLEKIDNNK